MTNKELSRLLKTQAMLMELHEENQFKVKMYDSASQLIRNSNTDFSEVPDDELETYDGIGKKIAQAIVELRENGTTEDLSDLLKVTPPGLIEVLNLKGVGPKKVRALWKDLQVETLEDVVKVCQSGEVARIKGFGQKTQEKILEIARFNIESRGKLLYAEAEVIAEEILSRFPNLKLTGELVRGLDIITKIQFLTESKEAFDQLDNYEALKKQNAISSPFVWRGTESSTGMLIEVLHTSEQSRVHFYYASGPGHLGYSKDGKVLGRALWAEDDFDADKFYDSFGLPYIPEGSREGQWELEADQNRLDHLITQEDITGIIHNHSTWSDGKYSIAEMAMACKERGYTYFGIADHSKSAFYANGLYEDRVYQQQEEIDTLNKQLDGIKILKGIEADILSDGNLDYADDVLKTFDYVVASIHSILDMNLDKSMERLIKAIENPHTTILGHLTGRLLLRREQYPVNHKMIIDACADNEVIIEINANPWRLDMDWKYIDYAMEKGVLLSINPDAHSIEGIDDVKYGVIAARKGGLTKEFCLNAKPLSEIEKLFSRKKSMANG